MKVTEAATRSLAAGHPWVFRDSVQRPVEGLEPGAPTRVLDPDGRRLGWALLEPEGAIAARMVARGEGPFAWTAEEIAARVKAARRYREAALGPEIATAHRIIHGEGDGIPGLAVDRYGDFLLIYKYARSVESFLDTLVEVLREELAPKGIYMQDRIRPVTADDRRPPAFHLAGEAAPPEIEVIEDGLHFLVDVTAPVSPGLFLDLREGRRVIESISRGKRVLNLFSFTGSIGLRAVRGGATRVANVDAAARSHARCRQNLAASGLDSEACEALVGDVFKHLERLRRRGEQFDLVVVDPPPFSRVKGKVFSALSDWEELMAGIARVTAPDGYVMAISNASKLSEDELMNALGTGAIAGGREPRLVGERGLPPDFPVPPAFHEGRYLRIKLLLLP